MAEHSILIVEDHSVFGKALRMLLSQRAELNVVGVAHSGEEALEQLPTLDVELALIDVSLPEMNGIQLVSKIREKFPNIHCLVLSGHLTPLYVKRALDAGARGYVLKDDVSGVVEGIQEVLKGGVYLSPAIRNQYDAFG